MDKYGFEVADKIKFNLDAFRDKAENLQVDKHLQAFEINQRKMTDAFYTNDIDKIKDAYRETLGSYAALYNDFKKSDGRNESPEQLKADKAYLEHLLLVTQEHHREDKREWVYIACFFAVISTILAALLLTG